MNDRERLRWLRERQQGIGGSDVGALLGLSRYRTPLDLYFEKTRPIEAVGDSSLAAELGNFLEPLIRRKYVELTGNRVKLAPEPITHPGAPFMRCNLDGIVIRPDQQCGVLQIKTAGDSSEWGEPGSDEIPLPYFWQVQHEMIVSGLPFADVPVLFFDHGRRIELFHVDADAELQERLKQLEGRFWGRVLRRIPPDPIDLDDVKRRYPIAREGKTIEADPGLIEELAKFQQTKEQVSVLDERKDQLEQKIRERVADASAIVGADGKTLATLNRTERRGIDLEKLTRTYPEIAEDLRTVSSYRTLRIKK